MAYNAVAKNSEASNHFLVVVTPTLLFLIGKKLKGEVWRFEIRVIFAIALSSRSETL